MILETDGICIGDVQDDSGDGIGQYDDDQAESGIEYVCASGLCFLRVTTGLDILECAIEHVYATQDTRHERDDVHRESHDGADRRKIQKRPEVPQLIARVCLTVIQTCAEVWVISATCFCYLTTSRSSWSNRRGGGSSCRLNFRKVFDFTDKHSLSSAWGDRQSYEHYDDER